MPYTVRKVDRNHAAVRNGLRDLGYGALDIHALGDGAPDLLVLTPWGMLELLEVKMPSEKLTEDEAKFHRKWGCLGGHIHIAYSAEQIHTELSKERERWLSTLPSTQ